MAQGSMICPQCGKLIGMGEERCPFCGAWQPAMFGVAPALQRLFGRHLDIVWVIVTACIVLYVASLVLQPEAAFSMSGMFDILSPGTRALYQLGMTSGPVTLREHWWWTLLTANYLHGNLLHIFFNVMWIRQLGPEIANLYGAGRMILIYTAAGITGFTLSSVMYFLNVPFFGAGVTVGASASIFGFLGALVHYGRRTGSSHIGQAGLQYALFMGVMGFIFPGVDNAAHLGGFIGGYLTSLILDPLKKERIDHIAAALACLVLTLVALLFTLYKVIPLLG
jgi:rhomboid protease GluP